MKLRKINALYVTVFDMERAVSFYKKHIFRKEAKTISERFSIFDIEGFQFGLFNPKIENEEHLLGNNCVPNIEVEDVKNFYNEIKKKGIEIVLEYHNVGSYFLFQIKDSEENILEFYQIME